MNSTLALTKIKPASPIDATLLNVIVIVNTLFLSTGICLFGIVANIVNILNFRKQGYKDGVNVTLTALVISDLGVLITQQIIIQIYNPWLDQSNLDILKPHLFILIIFINEYFIRVSGLVTACAAFERCLCVVLPMKVKLVMTRRVAAVVNISIFVVMVSYVVTPYSYVYVGPKYIPYYNRTFGYVYLRGSEGALNDFYIIDALFIPNVTMVLLLMFTVVLVTKLKSKNVWRQRVSNTVNSARYSMTLKERKTIVMLLTMSVIYVVCLMPHTALNLVSGLMEELKVDGIYFDIDILVSSFSAIFEAINCSVTAVVYFKMSSKYREVIYDMLPCKRKK